MQSICLRNFYFAFIFKGLHWIVYSWLAFFFLSTLWMCHPTLYWPVWFLLRNPLITSVGSFVDNYFFFLLCFQDSVFAFDSFIIMFWGRLLEILRWSIHFMNLDVQISLQVWEIPSYHISKWTPCPLLPLLLFWDSNDWWLFWCVPQII